MHQVVQERLWKCLLAFDSGEDMVKISLDGPGDEAMSV
jgi:hypothetical protein